MKNKSILLSHSMIYAIGNIAQKVVGIIMLPIYTQLLTPADYGVIGMITFVLSLAEIALGAQLVQAVPKYFHDNNQLKDKNAVVFSGLLITFLGTTLVSLGLFSARENLSFILFNTNDLSLVVGLFSILVLNQAVQYHGLTYIRLLEKPFLYTSVCIIKLITQLSLNIYFVVILEMGILGVALSAAISSTIFAILLMTYTVKGTGWNFQKDITKKMISYCWPLWIGSLAGLYYGSSNRYFMNEFSSLTDIGLFELAVKITTVLSILVWNPFNLVWQSERFKIFKQANAKESYRKVFHYLSALMLIGALAVSLFGRPLVYLMADPAFLPASEIIPILSLVVVCTCFNTFFNFSFHATEKTKLISRNNYYAAFFITIPLLILVPKYGYIGAALSALLAGVFQLSLTYYSGRKRYEMGTSWVQFTFILTICVVIYSLDLIVTTDFDFINQLLFKGLLLILSVALTVCIIRQDPKIRLETNNWLRRRRAS